MKNKENELNSILNQIFQLTIDPSTPLCLCNEFVVDSYEAQIKSKDFESRKYSSEILKEVYNTVLDKIENLDERSESIILIKKIIDDVILERIETLDQNSNINTVSSTSFILYEKLITQTFNTIYQRIDYLMKNKYRLENSLYNLDAHLGAAENESNSLKLYEKLKEAEKKKILYEAEYKRQINILENLNRQKTLLVNKSMQLIKTIANNENENDDNARIVKYAVMSIEVLTEFKIRLQREKIDKLSENATKCFKNLVEKDTFVSKIEINTDNLDVTIIDSEGNEILKNQLSAGEQQMFAIAIVWALALTSGYKAPVIIDTPMARLDSSHRINFVTKYLPVASSQVLVLSTDEEIYGNYLDLIRDNVLDYYTLLYDETTKCTSIVQGYFDEVI